jgi:hypothetical protein
MFDKIKDIGVQVASKANETVGGIATSMKGGVETLANNANDRAVRASTAQMCSILELAIEEMKNRPIAERRVSLTATVNIGIASLEMQVHLEPQAGERSGTESVPLPAPPGPTTA